MADEKQTTEMQDATPKTMEELKHTRTIDTIHQDEALRVLAQYAGDETWTPEEEKKLVRRLDRKLISLLIITYGLQYYDKAMLSQAVRSPEESHCCSLIHNQGAFWITRRPRPYNRESLFILCRHLLPWIHRGELPRNSDGPALAD